MANTIDKYSPCLAFLLVIFPIAPCLSEETSVFNGDEVKVGTTKYNYIVELRRESEPVCTGILVGNQWVLTAAHCALLAERVVPLGASDGSLIDRPFCHPSYVTGDAESGLDTKNDLALLRTTEPLGGSWQQKDLAVDPDPSDLVFFGYDKNSILKKAKPMQLHQGQKCNEVWDERGQIVDGNEFCAGDSESSACLGDSGGPIFNTIEIASVREPKALVGILSKADNGCTASGVYDIYTRIASDWIKKIIDGDYEERSRSICE